MRRVGLARGKIRPSAARDRLVHSLNRVGRPHLWPVANSSVSPRPSLVSRCRVRGFVAASVSTIGTQLTSWRSYQFVAELSLNPFPQDCRRRRESGCRLGRLASALRAELDVGRDLLASRLEVQRELPSQRQVLLERGEQVGLPARFVQIVVDAHRRRVVGSFPDCLLYTSPSPRDRS